MVHVADLAILKDGGCSNGGKKSDERQELHLEINRLQEEKRRTNNRLREERKTKPSEKRYIFGKIDIPSTRNMLVD
jgi:hypothetical protein